MLHKYVSIVQALRQMIYGVTSLFAISESQLYFTVHVGCGDLCTLSLPLMWLEKSFVNQLIFVEAMNM